MSVECIYKEISKDKVMPNYSVDVNYCKIRQNNPSDLACEHCSIQRPDKFKVFKNKIKATFKIK